MFDELLALTRTIVQLAFSQVAPVWGLRWLRGWARMADLTSLAWYAGSVGGGGLFHGRGDRWVGIMRRWW